MGDSVSGAPDISPKITEAMQPETAGSPNGSDGLSKSYGIVNEKISEPQYECEDVEQLNQALYKLEGDQIALREKS